MIAALEAVAMGKHRVKPNYRRRLLRLPDLDHCKRAVLHRRTLTPHRTQRADFLALRSPVCFLPWVMRPVQLGSLSARSIGLGSPQTAPMSRIATAYSTAPSRTLGVSVHASNGVEPSSLPSL